MINRYASLKQGLVGAWCPSLGASGYRLLDRSGNGNHGTLTNMDPGTDWVPSGGKLALDFDGVNDRVACGNPANVAFGSQNHSFCAWVNPSSLGANNVVFGKDANPGRQFSAAVTSSGSNYVLFMSDASFYGVAETSNSIVAGSWNHIVFQRNGSSLELWSNGIRRTTSDISGSSAIGTMQSTSTSLLLGARAFSGFENYYAGQIDDVRIYNRALTPQEIRLLYTGGRGVGLMPERIKHRRKTTAAATNRRRRLICGANC